MGELTNTYNQEVDFSFPSTMEWVSNHLQLKLQDNPGQDFTEDFADDTGHTYDSDVSEFSSGKWQQKDQRPTNAVAYVNFESTDHKANIQDLNFGDGDPVVTLGGNANVHDDYLDLTDGNAYIEIPIDNFAAMQSSSGCIRKRMSFDYSGAASDIQYIIQTSPNVASRVYLVHNSTFIQCYITNTGGTTIYSMTFSWTPSQGTIYEFEVDWTSTHAYVFINGQLQDSDTGTLGMSEPTLFRIGQFSNCKLKIYDLIVFSTLQHSSNYTPSWSSIPDADWLESYDLLPEMVYTGAGTLISFGALTYTITGNMLIALQIGRSSVYTFWNGSAWVTGDGTKDYMCAITDFVANIATLDIEGEIYVQFKIYFPISYTQGDIDELTASLTAQIYSTSNPYFSLASDVTAEAITSLLISFSASGNDTVRGVLTEDGTDYYYDGSNWVESDGTYSQSSTIANMQDNIVDFSDEDNHSFNMKIFLHSDAGLTTPYVSSIILAYYYSLGSPTVYEIREFLEGYGVTSTQLTGSWIRKRRDKTIIPYLENKVGFNFDGETTVTKYLSGTGKGILILPHKNIIELIDVGYVYSPDESGIASLSLDSIILLASEGILKKTENLSEGAYNSTFRKGTRNIVVQYKIGSSTIPDDLREAVIYLMAEMLLGFIGARTGGGSLGVQGFNRGYGDRGKYQDLRNDLARQARAIIKRYKSHVTGTV